jgi:hypothetical protein
MTQLDAFMFIYRQVRFNRLAQGEKAGQHNQGNLFVRLHTSWPKRVESVGSAKEQLAAGASVMGPKVELFRLQAVATMDVADLS